MRYSIAHHTSYEYNDVVSVSHHLLRLKPRNSGFQDTLQYKLNSDPWPGTQESHEDYFGNNLSFMTIEGPHRQLKITAEFEVEVRARAPVDASLTPSWEYVRELSRGDSYSACGDACEFIFPSTYVPLRPEFHAYANSAFAPGRPVLEAGIELMGRIHQEFSFDPEATTIATPVEQAFRQRRGVCQDFAHLQIACLRAMGLPARYVSGYLETVPPPGKAKLVGADASHAWIQLWCAEFGWIDLDPTNNVLPSERHITLAWGRDYSDVSPLRGVLVGSGSHRLKVAVDVNQIGSSVTG